MPPVPKRSRCWKFTYFLGGRDTPDDIPIASSLAADYVACYEYSFCIYGFVQFKQSRKPAPRLLGRHVGWCPIEPAEFLQQYRARLATCDCLYLPLIRTGYLAGQYTQHLSCCLREFSPDPLQPIDSTNKCAFGGPTPPPYEVDVSSLVSPAVHSVPVVNGLTKVPSASAVTKNAAFELFFNGKGAYK